MSYVSWLLAGGPLARHRKDPLGGHETGLLDGTAGAAVVLRDALLHPDCMGRCKGQDREPVQGKQMQKR